MTVYCEAHSPSVFSISWVKVQGNMTGNIEIQSKTEEKNSYVIKGMYMTFTNLSAQDTGQYMCIAENIAGKLKRDMYVRMKSK